MIKKIFLLLLLLLIVACGHKSRPISKDMLDIPVPDNMVIKLEENNIVIINETQNQVLVERSDIFIGDFTELLFERKAFLSPGETYVDSSVMAGKKYRYSFRTYSSKYSAYSDPVTKFITVEGDIRIIAITKNIKGDILCMDIEQTEDTAAVDIIVNGKVVQRQYRETSICLTMPAVGDILLAVIPYAETGIQGEPYSESFKVVQKDILLPPQGIQIIRGDDSIVLSWMKDPNALFYKVYLSDGETPLLLTKTDINLFTYRNLDMKSCHSFGLESLNNEKVSKMVEVTSCP